MAVLSTSGTYAYSASVINILTASLRLAQIIGDEETPTGAQLQNGFDAFSAMVAGWSAAQIHLWCEEEMILFPQPGQTLYRLGPASSDHATLFNGLIQTSLASKADSGTTALVVASVDGMGEGVEIGVQLDAGTNFWSTVVTISGLTVTIADPLPSAATAPALVFAYLTPLMRPLRMMGYRRYSLTTPVASRYDVPMTIWARLDYQAQPNKYTPGVITAAFFDPQQGEGAYTLPTAQLNLWPSPSDYTYAFRGTIQRPVQDLGSLASIQDFPVEWNAALKWNLAMEIGPQYGTTTEQLQIIDKQATRWYALASQWDREPESVLFGVAMQPGYRTR